jgi:hypothetical protein
MDEPLGEYVAIENFRPRILSSGGAVLQMHNSSGLNQRREVEQLGRKELGYGQQDSHSLFLWKAEKGGDR